MRVTVCCTLQYPWLDLGICRSCSQSQSITQTWCPGKCWQSAPAQYCGMPASTPHKKLTSRCCILLLCVCPSDVITATDSACGAVVCKAVCRSVSIEGCVFSVASKVTLPLYCGLQDVLSMIGPKTKLVSLVHVSNTLGSILPTGGIVAAAHQVINCRRRHSRPVLSASPGMCCVLAESDACCVYSSMSPRLLVVVVVGGCWIVVWVPSG